MEANVKRDDICTGPERYNYPPHILAGGGFTTRDEREAPGNQSGSPFPFLRNMEIRSMGNGKMVVEFFSAAISVRVCR